jgi:hypothetical protein
MARPNLARVALTLGLLWLAAGALYKLFEGSPNDLPATVKEHSPLGALDTMRLAIGIELAVIGLVIAVPRIGWFFLSSAFAVFIAVLVPLALAGEASCGCFGGNISIDPKVMLAVDGALLVMILATRPWSVLPRESGLGAASLLPFFAVAALAPYGKIKPAVLPPVEPRASVVSTDEAATGDPSSQPAATVDVGTSSQGAAPADGTGVTGSPPPVAEAPASPLKGVEFHDLRVSDWVGQDAWATDLTFFYEAGASAGFAQGAFLPNSHVIVYRQTCHDCKEHLEQVWQEQQNGDPKWQGRTIVLLRLEEAKDTAQNNVCTMLPEPSEKITFPTLKRGYGITTPYSFDLDEAGLIQNPVDLRKGK